MRASLPLAAALLALTLTAPEDAMAKELQAGDKAPAFSLKDGNGQVVTLAGLAGKWVVLYFYPKDDTPGCTKEACSFQEHLGKFTRSDTVILGVSADTEASHQKFASKFGLTFTLLSDPDRTVCNAYGVIREKSMYGKLFKGIDRSTFVIGPDGRLAAVFRGVKVDGHTEEVLAAIQRASKSPAPAR